MDAKPADCPAGTERRPPSGTREPGAVSLPAFGLSLFRSPVLSSTDDAQCPIILCQDAVGQHAARMDAPRAAASPRLVSGN